MENIFNQFMHIYFWVFVVIFISTCIVNTIDEDYKNIKPKEIIKISLGQLIAMTLFIMSIKY